MNRYTEAKIAYSKILKDNANYSMAYYGLGIVAEKEKNYREAIGQYSKFISMSDNDSLKKTIERRITLLRTRL